MKGEKRMEIQEIRNELVKYSATDAAIAEMSKNYLALTIKDINDQEEYKLVHSARMDVKSKRVAVKKRGEELREDANIFRNAVIDEVKRITALLSPIEDHLQDEENRIEEEKERVKREAAEKLTAILRERANVLGALGCQYYDEIYSYGELKVPLSLLKVCTDEQFATFVSAITEAIEKDQAIKAEEARVRKEKDDLYRKIAEDQERERQRLEKEARLLQEEREKHAADLRAEADRKIRAEEQARRAEELAKAKKEAAEKARIETEERIKKEAADTAAREVAAAEEKIRKAEAARIRAEKKEARRPDKEKLLKYLDFMDNLPVLPMLKTEEGIAVYEQIFAMLSETVERMRTKIEEL